MRLYSVSIHRIRKCGQHCRQKFCEHPPVLPRQEFLPGIFDCVTLHEKVDIPEEASLPWGVQDVQEEKSKTIHG
jgi:hypothetical protein